MVGYSAILREMILEALEGTKQITAIGKKKYAAWEPVSRRNDRSSDYELGLQSPKSQQRIYIEGRIFNDWLLNEIYMEFSSKYEELTKRIKV